MGRLSGKRVLLTGAGGLMGSDLARAFAAEGGDLVLTTRTAAKLDSLIEEIVGMRVRAVGIAADFTAEEDVDRLANAAWDAFGGIDVVVLSSQPAEPNMGDLFTTSDADWRNQQDAILWGPFRLLRQLVPRIIAAGDGGSIVTVISSTGLEPIPGYAAYGMAKGGLWLLTQYMAAEWGKHSIRANAICPGTIATGANPEEWEKVIRERGMLDRTSLGRVGTNRECAGAAIYLASDESSFTSGQRIHIDGGRF